MSWSSPGAGRRPIDRPTQAYSAGLQHERTALAWERTAFSLMGAGVVLARFASVEGIDLLAFAGLLVVGTGVGLVLWASLHYERRHEELRQGHDLAHPRAAQFVGIAATATCLLCLGTALVALH